MFPPAERGSPTAATYGPLPKGDLPVALVYHTTETVSWARFRLGLTAPHYQYKAITREWRWHGAALDRRVGTMRSSMITRTPANEKAIQVEIVAYSDANIASKHPARVWVGDFQEHNYRDLAEFAAWAGEQTPLLRLDHVTLPPPGGWRYGAASPYRQDRQDWLDFDGISAHGSVTGQSHWDTGILELGRIAAYAQELAPPPPPPTIPPGEDDMSAEEQLNTPDWVRALSDEAIDKLFDDGLHIGQAQHWKNLKTNPEDPQWESFRRSTYVRRPYYY